MSHRLKAPCYLLSTQHWDKDTWWTLPWEVQCLSDGELQYTKAGDLAGMDFFEGRDVNDRPDLTGEYESSQSHGVHPTKFPDDPFAPEQDSSKMDLYLRECEMQMYKDRRRITWLERQIMQHDL